MINRSMADLQRDPSNSEAASNTEAVHGFDAFYYSECVASDDPRLKRKVERISRSRARGVPTAAHLTETTRTDLDPPGRHQSARRLAALIDLPRRVGRFGGTQRVTFGAMNAADSNVIDCDSHVMEPPDLWEKYLEPKFRDRAIRIVKDPADGLEVLMVDNQPLLKGMLAGLGGANQPRQELFIPGRLGYLDGCPPASYLPADRVKLLDEWGVSAGVLFPTVGILWDVEDHGLASATRALTTTGSTISPARCGAG